MDDSHPIRRLLQIMETQGGIQYDLKEKYAYFNRKCFGGELPTIPLKFGVLKKYGGFVKFAAHSQVRNGKKVPGTKTLVPNSMSIVISSTYSRSEEEIDAILLHEMIHVWFIHNGNLSENHGMAFNAKRKEISACSGIEVPRTEAFKNHDLNIADRAVSLIMLTLKSGKVVYGIVNPTFLSKNVAAILERAGGAEKQEIVVVKSEYWTKKSLTMAAQRTVKLKLYYMDKEGIDDIAKNGKIVLSRSAQT
jgi:hypothetical protein